VQTNEVLQESTVAEEQQSDIVSDVEVLPEKVPFFEDSVALQDALDLWSSELPIRSTASVVIADTDGTLIASRNKDESYFAASIYKMFVAYAGYQQIDIGIVDPGELYLGSITRAECLDLMIRESDSPCAEKLWNELGKQELTNQLISYGITNTSMVNITTTANDSAIMLGRIVRGQGLELPSKTALLESMREQIYTEALRSGFSDAVTVYSKVGFNGQDEYHDLGIIELTDGRQVILSVMTDNVGTSRIADLATKIELLIQK
jgi:beta-lactamase class A